jgi:type VI secretion system secreted protein Hcp
MNVTRIIRHCTIISFITLAAIAWSSSAHAASNGNVSVKGKTQGQFKGDSTSGKRKDMIAVLSFNFGLSSPRDVASGQASGRRRLDPVCFVKEWSGSTPQFYQAATTNELLSEVKFEFYRTNPNGEEYAYQTISLTDASISQIKMYTSRPSDTSSSAKTTGVYDLKNVEEICLSFRKITISNTDAKTTYVDDWATKS